MSKLDEYIDRAGAGAVIMASIPALEDIRANTPPKRWRHQGGRDFYMGARVEIHDEWSWGWMVRKADGTYVEDALAAGARSAETNEDSAQSEGRQSGPKGNAQTQSDTHHDR